jgi:hypothetical protein
VPTIALKEGAGTPLMTSSSIYDYQVDDFYSIPRWILIESRHGAASLRHGNLAIGRNEMRPDD